MAHELKENVPKMLHLDGRLHLSYPGLGIVQGCVAEYAGEKLKVGRQATGVFVRSDQLCAALLGDPCLKNRSLQVQIRADIGDSRRSRKLTSLPNEGSSALYF
jgi:hypothetical protein